METQINTIKTRKLIQRTEELPNSEWKPLYGYENEYLISNKRQIKSVRYHKKNIILTPLYNKKNIGVITLTKDGVDRRFFIDDLIALYYFEGEALKNHFDNLPIMVVTSKYDNIDKYKFKFEVNNIDCKILDEAPLYAISNEGNLRYYTGKDIGLRNGKFDITGNGGKRLRIKKEDLMDKYFNKYNHENDYNVVEVDQKASIFLSSKTEKVSESISQSTNIFEGLITELELEKNNLIEILGEIGSSSYVNIYNRFIDKINKFK